MTPRDSVFGPGLTDADRWQAWAEAFVEICKRIVDEATEKPGRHGAAGAEELRRSILRLRELAEVEPDWPLRNQLVVTLDGQLCLTCGAPNGGGYVTPGCPDCADLKVR